MILSELYNLEESSGHSLQGSFTHDLTKSKVWLIQELARIQPSISTMYILGSWYGNLALCMTLEPDVRVKKFINVEINQDMLDQSQRMLNRIGATNVEYMNKDANDLDYSQLDKNGAVINCSLTDDIDGTEWLDHIPNGTLVVMQARDHVKRKPFYSTQDILKKFPLSSIMYQGELELQDPETKYTRYMVIGRK